MDGDQHGVFHWNELVTRDVEGAKAFYASVCGWTYEAMQFGEMTYTIAMSNGAPAGGMFEMKGPEFEGKPECWMSYIAVDDCDAAAAAGKAGGGQVAQEPFDVPGVGRIAIMVDSTGAVIGVIKPAEQAA